VSYDSVRGARGQVKFLLIRRLDQGGDGVRNYCCIGNKGVLRCNLAF